MSYQQYHTEGFIFSSTVAGESNRYYYVYTKDVGLIGVWGQGVRKLESKLRYNMKDFTFVKIQVVRGKNMWRLTDVERISSCEGVHSSPQKRVVLGKIVSLMRRLLDEGEDEKLYELFSSLVRNIERAPNREVLKDIELLFVVRMLEHLGYGKVELSPELLDHTNWDKEILSMVNTKRSHLARSVNTSLHESQM